jgi:hypothetical protein
MMRVCLIVLCLVYAHSTMAAQGHSKPAKKNPNHDLCATEAWLHMPKRSSRSSHMLFRRKPMPMH